MKLNVQKCEIVHFGLATLSPHQESVNSTKAAVKCLGYWWSRDLLSKRTSKKARGCFFQVRYSRVSFQGDFNLLSTKSVIDTCVMSVSLYGCDNWILTEKSVQLLESFLGWTAKRALKWPQHLSTTAALVSLVMETVKSRILIRKYLLHLLSDGAEGVGTSAVHALLDDPDSLCIVKS